MIYGCLFLLINLPGIYGQQLSNEKADLRTLRFVHAVWRHGDRTPSRTIPSDRWNTLEKWNTKFGGLSQLTDLGAAQQFELGKMLRHRYDGFLPITYNPTQFVYRSSGYNRTKMSALANIQGMFALPEEKGPPRLPLEEYAPEGLEFGALPIGYDPIVFDAVECRRANEWEDWLFSNDNDFNEAGNANADFLHFVAGKSGFNEQLTLRHINYVHDPLNSIARHQSDGFQLPEWANATVRAEIFRLYNLKNSFNFKSDLLKRLWPGPLYTEILERMKKIAAANDADIAAGKFHAYSAHDTTVAGILSIFGIYPTVYPTYATAVLIELHANASSVGKPFVRVFYKNETDSTTLWEYTHIPGCDGWSCELEQLERSRHHFMISVDEWHAECAVDGQELMKTAAAAALSEGQQRTTMSNHLLMFAPILLIVSCMLIVPDDSTAFPFFGGNGFFASPPFFGGGQQHHSGEHHGGWFHGGHHGWGHAGCGGGHANGSSANANVTIATPPAASASTIAGNSTAA